jgi:predicted aminopeptidase
MRARLLLICLLFLLLGGCASLGYYGQAVGGHVKVMQRRVPLAHAIADPVTQPATRARLQQVEQIRDFAISELGLPDNGSYRSYADLERPFVLWNVFAAPEFELTPLQSCFPLVGCLSYRGYYSESDARAYAAGLRERGYDVHVGGVAAYSTLGWFSDPVLSSMLRWSESQLAGVIFHELAHQKLYVRDDSSFNESFATAVQEEGLRRWLGRQGNEALRAAAAEETRRREDFVRLAEATRARLQQLYGSGQPSAQMRAAKAQVFADMRAEYARLRAAWGGYDGYDAWFDADDLNNAKLLAVATYHEWVPAFRQLLSDVGGDLPRFYMDAELASRLPPEIRRRWLSGWGAVQPLPP